MVPDGWYETKLGHVFKSRRSRGEAGLPTLSVTLNDGLVRRDSLDRKMDTNLAPEEHLLVRKGDIAYNMMRMWQGASGLADHDALVSPAYVVLEPTEQIDPLFASYFFKTPRMIYLFWAYSHGLTEDRLRLYFDDFSLIPVTVPSLVEQRKMAEILATWDAAIDVVQRLITNSERQKHGLMQQLLTGNKRLPGFSGEWKSVAIRQMGKIVGGGTPESDNATYWNGDVLWATPTDITCLNGRYIRDTARKISTEGLAQSAARLLPIGAVLVCTRATIGELAIATGPITTNQGFKSVIPNKNYDSEFLFYLLQFNQHVLVRYASGSTFVELAKHDFENRSFYVPEIAEQKAIAAALANADDQTSALARQVQLLRSEKGALMQHLLAGTRRVKVEVVA